MIIGITGGSGAGKSTVSSQFEKLGYFVIDADNVAHKVMDAGTSCLKEVIDFFGEKYLNPDGTLNRKKLGNKVFADKNMLDELNRITHKHIINEIKFLAQDKSLVIIDAALLFESGLNYMCNKTIFVSSSFAKRVERIVIRDNVSEDYAIRRINAQQKDDFYREKCDFEIKNDDDENLALRVEEILSCLKD